MNGAREDFSPYLLDGIYNMDPWNGWCPTSGGCDPRVRSAHVDYDATFNGGGQVNILTRSGSNRLAGAAYEFFRGGAFDSRNYFAPEDEAAPE